MRNALIRQGKHAIHLFGGERDCGRINPDIALAVLLHQRAGAAGVGFMVQNTRRVRVENLVAFHLLKGRQQDVGLLPRLRTRGLHGNALRFLFWRCDGFVIRARQIFTVRMRDWVDFPRRIQTRGIDSAPARQRLFHHDGGVANVANLPDRLAGGQTVRHFHQRTLAVAEHQHIGFGVHQNRATHGIRPVVVVRGTAQAGFDTAEDHRDIFPGFFTALGIDQRGAIRAFTGNVTRRVGIVMTQLAVGGVAVDHRIHVAGGDAEEQIRFTQAHKIVFIIPVRLGNNPHAKPLRFQHASANRHAEARVIDIGIAGNQNDVAAIPAKLIHLFSRHRQERRGAKAGGPVLRPGEKVTIRLDQGYCAHIASGEMIKK